MSNKKTTVSVDVKGKQLICPICSNTHFWQREAMLNTSVATFFGLDWTNKSAKCFVCSECTHVLWFLT